MSLTQGLKCVILRVRSVAGTQMGGHVSDGFDSRNQVFICDQIL